MSVQKEPRYADFIANAERCELIEPERLLTFIRDVYGEDAPRIESAVDLKPLVSKLVEYGELTLWQCEMVLMGRWKGFVTAGYELREAFCKRTDQQPFVFLARKIDTPETESVIEFADHRGPVKVICSRPRSRSLAEW